jgi:hypothetical protein
MIPKSVEDGITTDLSHGQKVSCPLTLEFPSSLPKDFSKDLGVCPSNMVVMDFTLS